MVIDWISITSKVPEIAMVLVFAYFAIRLVEHNKENTTEAVENWQGFLESQNKQWQVYFKERDETYIAALNVIRDRQDTNIERISLDIRQQNTAMLQMVEMLGRQERVLDEVIKHSKRSNNAD